MIILRLIEIVYQVCLALFRKKKNLFLRNLKIRLRNLKIN
uniref:Uncharacterized protein n=1 Tax=Bacteriophage sp. TaxID=38018 RepID=A0A8D9PF05_9VIRU|nr:MAG TPA: hypothetical protein [Bacteriophage sp.]